MNSTEERLAALEVRNKKVEADKAWETSVERRLSILVLTYIIAAIFLSLTGTPKPWVSAIVPSLGFFLSTLTLQFFRKNWLNRQTTTEEKPEEDKDEVRKLPV